MTKTSHAKEVFKHGLIYSGSSILSKAVGFMMLPIYANYLRGEGYGILGMVDVLISVIVLFVGFGIAGALGRLYFERDTAESRNVLVSTSLSFMALLVTTVSIPVLLFNEPLSKLVFGKEALGSYIVLAVVTFIFEATSKTAEAYLMIRKKSLLLSSLSLGRLVLGLSLNIYLIAYLKLGILGYFYSGLLVAILFSSILHLHVMLEVGCKFDLGIVKELLGYSLPLLPGYTAVFIRNNADRIFLRNYLGLMQLGVFEMLYKFATLIGVLIVEPFLKIWNVKRMEVCDTPEGPEVVARIFTLYMVVLLFGGLLLSLEIPLLLRLLTPKEFWLGEGISLLAVTSRIMDASYHQFNFGLVYAKKTFVLSYIQILSAILSLILNWVLIARLGFFGAVVASCIVATVQGCLALYSSRRYYFIPYSWRKIFYMTAIAGAIFLFAKDISLSGTIVGVWIEDHLSAMIRESLLAIGFDNSSKVFRHMVNNTLLLADMNVRLVLCLSFFPLVFFSGVLPSRDLKDLVLRKLGKDIEKKSGEVAFVQRGTSGAESEATERRYCGKE